MKERKIFKKEDWKKLFPAAVHRAEILKKLRIRVEKKMTNQHSRPIGEIREKKTVEALENLKKQGKIRDYIRSEKLGYLDLIQGVDFIIVYVDDTYRICEFSVTGPNWIREHEERHPEIPVIVVGLYETPESIERKIVSLKRKSN